MIEVKLSDAFQDAPKQGIPTENLQALKEFLTSRRGARSDRAKYAGVKLPAECEKLPEAVQRRLREFLGSIPSTRFLRPDGKPKPEWKVYSGFTWDDAKAAANVAAQNAVIRTPSFRRPEDDAAKAAARDDANSAAKEAAWFAASNAAGADGRDAAWSASSTASMIVVSDLEFEDKEKRTAQAKARWEVWQKGYGLGGDVEDVLYVYYKLEAPE